MIWAKTFWNSDLADASVKRTACAAPVWRLAVIMQRFDGYAALDGGFA